MNARGDNARIGLSSEALRILEFLRTARATCHKAAVSEASVREWTGIQGERIASLHVELANVGVYVVPVCSGANGEGPLHLYVDSSLTRRISTVRQRLGLGVHDFAQQLEEKGSEQSVATERNDKRDAAMVAA